MLWLHIGMPKTGSTALQGFLRKNGGILAAQGLTYMLAGRQRLGGSGNLPISHNRIIFEMNRSPDIVTDFRNAMSKEFEENRERTCLVSSEMFYTANMQRLAEVFLGIPADEMNVLFYCRRYSDFFEADYKQRAKNGRILGGATRFVEGRLKQIKDNPFAFSFSDKVAKIRAAFPGVSLTPCIYARDRLRNGNVIDDLVERIGVELPDNCVTDFPANPSLSRVASEAFGIVTRSLGKKESRRLRRRSFNDPVMLRRHDVLHPEERVWLDNLMESVDEDFRREFFPERDTLFGTQQSVEAEKQFRRDTAEEVAQLQRACEIVLQMALDTQK